MDMAKRGADHNTDMARRDTEIAWRETRMLLSIARMIELAVAVIKLF